MRHLIVATLASSLFAASLPAAAQSSLAIDWEWKLAHRCNNTSPALSVTGIPEGTKSLAFQMNDLDFQNKDHGGGTVPHAGGASAEIVAGALSANYLGPCPNNFASFGHDYRVTVKALGADGAVLATSAKAKTFSAATAK